MGDFEFALVFYHRGYKLRPDREFKVGIQKAQEAINNSVGSKWLWDPRPYPGSLLELLGLEEGLRR